MFINKNSVPEEMMVCLIRYNEIALKGKNMGNFEDVLIKNIRYMLIKNRIDFRNIRKSYKRILIYTSHNCSILSYVFGVASFSYAVEADLDMGNIKNSVLDLVKNKKFKKFRISANRSNKLFQYPSLKINYVIGDFIRNKFKKKVDLKNFDLDIAIDVLDKAYISVNKTKGPGGLPLGVEGKVVSLIDGKESLLASYLVMKRGCLVVPVAYKKFNIGLLKKFDNNLRINIVKNAREIEKIAWSNDAKALVSGQALNNLEEIKTKLVILRPLIGLNEEEIKDKLHYLEKL